MHKQIGAFFVLFVLLVTVFTPSSPVAQGTGIAPTTGPSGLPLPRFVALHAEKVHMRTGPGTHYPIAWVYKRKSLPMEVIDEHGPWRKVRDHQNTTGWIHVQLLKGPRYAMIRSKTRNLHAEPDLNTPILVVAEAGVTGQLLECEGIWCQVNIEGREAWIERRHLWGVYKNEVID